MIRVVVLGAVMAIGMVSLIAVSAQQEEMVVEVEQLEDNLYVLRGGGGNSAAFVTSDGVVLVDTKIAGWGQPLLDTIGELTSNPVTTIINTHAHFDHVSGNVEFPASVEFVAHENAKVLMEEWNPVTGFSPATFRTCSTRNNGPGLPTRTFADRLTLGSGADQVDLYYFGRGHTGGDAWVVFPSLRTMHAGDMFCRQVGTDNRRQQPRQWGGVPRDLEARSPVHYRDRHHHYWARYPDDNRRPGRVCAVRRQFRDFRDQREDGGPNS